MAIKDVLLLSLSALVLLSGSRPGLSQTPQTPPDTAPPSKYVVPGKPLLVVVTAGICGPLEKEAPFDPKTYGTIRGFNPAGSKETKIILYTHVLDERFFRLASAIDKMVAKTPKLARSQVIVIDDKGAQRGGYTAEEVEKRRQAIRQLAASHNINHLSFFIAAPRASYILPILGLSAPQPIDATDPAEAAKADTKPTDKNATNLLLTYFTENPEGRGFAVLKWSTPLQSAKLNNATIPETLTALQKAIEEK